MRDGKYSYYRWSAAILDNNSIFRSEHDPSLHNLCMRGGGAKYEIYLGVTRTDLLSTMANGRVYFRHFFRLLNYVYLYFPD